MQMSPDTTESADRTVTTAAPPGDSFHAKTLTPKSHVIKIHENPISTLNDMRLGKVDYTFSGKSGPDHCPIFEITLDINGHIFKGEGPNKNSAKYDAANKALNRIFQVSPALAVKKSEEEVNKVFTDWSSTSDGDVKTVSLLPTSKKAFQAFSQNLSSSRENKKFYDNPISILNNMKLGLVNYSCIGKTGPDHSPIFEVVLDVNGHEFTGKGPNKQSAKYDAANKALNCILVARHRNKIEERNKIQEIEEASTTASSDSADTTDTSSSQPNTTVSTTAPASFGFPMKKNIRIYENPISTLNDMGLGKIDYIFIGKSGSDHSPIFKVSVDINGHIFTGEGPSRKKAKHEAAKEALKHILLPRDTLEVSGSEKTNDETFSLSSTRSDNASQRNTKEKNTVMRNVNINKQNPISILNEIRSGLKYELIEQSGPPHNPIFKISIEVDGQTYFGEGHSKKAAKTVAACEALKSFTQFLGNGTSFLVDRINSKKTDVTADHIVDKAKALKLINGKVAKGPLMLLNELYPNAEFTYVINDINPYARFKYTIRIRNQSFTGTGSNKKLAKNAAALSALSKLINYSLNNQLTTSIEHKSVNCEDQEKADTIGRLVNEKFSSLFVNDFTYMRRKVLAGIVMTRGFSLTDAEVICVTTGTKCVSGEHMSINGASLNDMHAEVLSRRCLMNFLYDQLQLLLDPALTEKSIFVLKSDGKGYQLKEGIEFHLYINTAPCGDARIFSPHEDHPSIDQHPNRSSRGQLRTKIESGEGTIPVKHAPSLQTWDGIIQGERLLTMSCSDKICSWNVLGLQGALLSYFIEPIYLKTIVLGSLLKETHLYRAICGRIEGTLKELPSPFVLNKPTMLKLTSVETRQPQKAPNFSVIWMVGMEKPEIINTFMGKPEEGISIVAKQNLAKRFADIYRSLSTMITINENISTYQETKERVQRYNVAKKSLYEAFRNALLGTWISKPIEQDMFDIVSSAF